ncbi:O-antigen ligase family protein [Bacillus wiedmannii]|uniref:O-antigen ligase family protein n=1 Tax=Bacillus wiedmannii TaxID=1890302 RepID=UPI003D97ECDF
MSYLFTICLLISLMYPDVLSPQLIVPVCCLCIFLSLIKNKLLMIKGLVYIHILWIMFFIFLGVNYFHYHNNEFYAELLLFICLAGSMYIGIFAGINFNKSLLYVFVGWVFIVQLQLFTKNSIDQVLNERWTITTGWLNSNAVGAILVFSIPLLFLCFYVTQSKLLKIIVLVEGIISVLVIFLLSSRGSLLGLGVVLMFMFLISRKKFRNTLIIIPFLIIIIPIILNIDIVQQSVELTFKRINSSGLNGRELLWSEGLELIKNNPIYGVGARNGGLIDLHNPFLHIATHYGLFTVVPFMLLILSPLVLIKLKQFKEIYIACSFATYLAILAQSSLEAILTPLVAGSVGWYFIGLIYGALIKYRKNDNFQTIKIAKREE